MTPEAATSPGSTATRKLLILSDIHLMARDENAHDLDNLARLRSAIDRINEGYGDADLVVFAGDLADRGRPESYVDLSTELARLTVPYTLTIGNHDDRDAFRAHFGETYCDENGFIQSAHDLRGLRVLVLDSVKTGPTPEGWRNYGAGSLCETRLKWLDHQLAGHPGPVIVVMHHPTLHLGITTDAIALDDPEPFMDRLVTHGNVRGVLAGHIHMTTSAVSRGIVFTTLAGNFSTSHEAFGSRQDKTRRSGPAQMAVVLSGAEQTTIHFDNYANAHEEIAR
jgi:3',5'-cyclic AMP phosphodiesterase CpdA